MSVVDRLERSNPVPSDERLLSGAGAMDHFVESVKARSGLAEPVPSVNRRGRSLQPDRKFPGVLVAVAAAIATLAMLGPAVLLWGGSSASEPVTPADTPINQVNRAYEALNSGEIDRWIRHFTEDAIIFGLDREETADFYDVLSVIGHRSILTEPCVEVESPTEGSARVVCIVTESNDFHGSAGITVTREETFVLSEDGRIRDASARVVEMTQPGYYVFNQAFFDWLHLSHPDVHAEIRPEITTHLPLEPKHMEIAVGYLDEFLAQSDQFPVTER